MIWPRSTRGRAPAHSNARQADVAVRTKTVSAGDGSTATKLVDGGERGTPPRGARVRRSALRPRNSMGLGGPARRATSPTEARDVEGRQGVVTHLEHAVHRPAERG